MPLVGILETPPGHDYVVMAEREALRLLQAEAHPRFTRHSSTVGRRAIQRQRQTQMNSANSKNLILAIVLSLAVPLGIGWNYFYGAPQLQKDRQAQTQAMHRGRPDNPFTGATLPQSAARSADQTAADALAASKRIRIKRAPRQPSAWINLTGRAFDDLTLKLSQRQALPDLCLFAPQGGPAPVTKFRFVGEATQASNCRPAIPWTSNSNVF